MQKSKHSMATQSIFQRWLFHYGNKFKKAANVLCQNARPFLALKYWPIYGLAFLLGLYLCGPSHGFQHLKAWPSHFPGKGRIQSSETLERQLEHLKQQLQTAQTLQKSPAFNPATFSRPALGQIVQGFDWIESTNAWRLHTGVDIGLLPGSNIIAAAAGTIGKIQETQDGSYSVTLNHGDGWNSIYEKLAAIMVKEGQPVIKGVIIGTSGAKGCNPSIPSFHFGIYHDQQAMDPQKLIPGMTD